MNMGRLMSAASAGSSFWAGTTTGPLGLLARRPHSSSGALSLPPATTATTTMGLQRAGSTPSLGAAAAAAANPFAPSSAAAPSSTAVASSSTSAVVGPDPAGFAASCYFDMDAVLLTALDVAQGMRHLHRNNVLHAGVCVGRGEGEVGGRLPARILLRYECTANKLHHNVTAWSHSTVTLYCTDLKPANVLLKADSRDRRGFVAKVGVRTHFLFVSSREYGQGCHQRMHP